MTERRQFSVTLPHAVLHGELSMPVQHRGIVVFVAALGCAPFAAAGDAAGYFLRHGFCTLIIDLLLESEAHFTDAETHLPHLTDRLLAVLGQLHRDIAYEVIPQQSIGLIAAGAATPLAVRVAALRDDVVDALVCHGGLVDLAGLQYLKVLQAPLLMIVDKEDVISAANMRRAMPHIPGVTSLEFLPDTENHTGAASAALALAWFDRYLKR